MLLQCLRVWTSHLWFSYWRWLVRDVGVKGFARVCALVLIHVFAVASDSSNITNLSSSVLDGFGCVAVLVSLIATSSVQSSFTSQHHISLLKPFVGVCKAIVCRMGLG